MVVIALGNARSPLCQSLRTRVCIVTKGKRGLRIASSFSFFEIIETQDKTTIEKNCLLRLARSLYKEFRKLVINGARLFSNVASRIHWFKIDACIGRTQIYKLLLLFIRNDTFRQNVSLQQRSKDPGKCKNVYNLSFLIKISRLSYFPQL